MARKFVAASSQFAQSTFSLAGVPSAQLNFWAIIDAYDNLGTQVLMEYGSPDWTVGNGFILVPDWTTGQFLVGMNIGGGAFWLDTFARPSAGVWHNYAVAFNRAGPTNQVWVDGVAQALAIETHDAGAYGNFTASTLNVFSRNGASLFCGGQMANLAVWRGINTDLHIAESSGKGASQSFALNRGIVRLFSPLYGQGSPEVDLSGAGNQLTLGNGPTITIHPPTQTVLPLRPGKGLQ